LKRGFSFFHYDLDGSAVPSGLQDRQLLVAASPHDRIADTHWFRADFDLFLVDQAQEIGAEYLDNLELTCCIRRGRKWSLQGSRTGKDIELEADFLIDATGPRGFLHRALQLREEPLPRYPRTSSLYTHFTGVRRFADLSALPIEGAPYPPDDAALHHVFDGGWIWVLHFNNGWTSAGVAATEAIDRRFELREGERAWHRLLNSLPLVKAQFEEARPQKAFTYLPQLPFLSSSIAGEGWAMLPSAAGFVDPLLSTGIPQSLLGISRLAELFSDGWVPHDFETGLHKYANQTRGDFLATSHLIGALYRNMGDFVIFRRLSLLYFAAVSYAETARRLGKPQLANSFLLREDPVYGPECGRLLQLATKKLTALEKQRLEDDILCLVEKFDVAGLTRSSSNHCYPVNTADLMASAYKLSATPGEIDAMLERSGFLLRAGGR
jgi:FADH2 O2-dependent halogenase